MRSFPHNYSCTYGHSTPTSLRDSLASLPPSHILQLASVFHYLLEATLFQDDTCYLRKPRAGDQHLPGLSEINTLVGRDKEGPH